MRNIIKPADDLERSICASICRHDGIKAWEIAVELNIDRKTVNQILYRSPLLGELCYKDDDDHWHGIIRQERPHGGLFEFSGYYGLVGDFVLLSEDEWLSRLGQGCANIGRNLNDTRGLIHSFKDSREQMIRLFADLREMLGESVLSWEIVFELRLKRAKHVRIYANVLVITENRVFSLEFKMKDAVDPDEVMQAAKYCPYLEIMFGSDYEVIPVLVLTAARDIFSFAPIGKTDMVISVCSGDMLFNVFDEYIGFLDK